MAQVRAQGDLVGWPKGGEGVGSERAEARRHLQASFAVDVFLSVARESKAAQRTIDRGKSKDKPRKRVLVLPCKSAFPVSDDRPTAVHRHHSKEAESIAPEMSGAKGRERRGDGCTCFLLYRLCSFFFSSLETT